MTSQNNPSRHSVIRHAFAAMAMLLLASACSTTRRIPDDEQLYIGVKKINIEAPEGQKVPEDVQTVLTEAVSVPPNNAIFKSAQYRWPFPVGLWVYNNWDNPPKGLKHWLYEKFVTEPVLVSDLLPAVRTKMVD